MIVQFAVRLFLRIEMPHPAQDEIRKATKEESVLTLISVTIRSLIFFICAIALLLRGASLRVVVRLVVCREKEEDDGVSPKTFVLCLRPHHDEHTCSRPITAVKHRRARIVLGWGTAWEHLVP